MHIKDGRWLKHALTRCVVALAALSLLQIWWVCGVHAAGQNVILATTTSTQDSGLLDVLVPSFEKRTGYVVKTVSVGTGQALTLGGRGEADVVLAHAPEAEKKYVTEETLINRQLVMHNDFIVVGPESDPARIRSFRKASDAFRKIARSEE